MAKLDDLIAHVGDAGLRRQLEEAAVELRRRKKFGLVFEQHIPETTMFPSETVQKGSVVMIRTEPSNKTRYVVDSVTKTTASISAGEEAWTIPVAGEYDDGTPMAEGFPENATFFDLVYADPDAIDVGAEFDDIVPALWMAAGCQGNPADLEHDAAWLRSSSSQFAVLLDEDHFRRFRAELSKHPEITHVWLVTDSETAFARMRDGISGSRTVGMLYRDYLRNFRVNVDMSAAAAGVL